MYYVSHHGVDPAVSGLLCESTGVYNANNYKELYQCPETVARLGHSQRAVYCSVLGVSARNELFPRKTV